MSIFNCSSNTWENFNRSKFSRFFFYKLKNILAKAKGVIAASIEEEGELEEKVGQMFHKESKLQDAIHKVCQ